MKSMRFAVCSLQKQWPCSLLRMDGGAAHRPLPTACSGRPKRLAGFTLVELLVVLAIIGTLLALAAPRYFQHVERSKEAVLRQNLAAMRDAIDQYHADTEMWPDSIETLVDKRYLRALPEDPITESTQTWITLSPPDGGGGVYDVRSGAEGVGMKGVPYSEW